MPGTRNIDEEIAQLEAKVAGDTAPRAFLRSVGARADRVALRAMVSDEPVEWQTLTFTELATEVAKAAAGLRAAGVASGHRVMLMLRNRPEFHIVDIAAQFLRATPVSIYNSSSPDEIAYLLRHAEAEVAVVEDEQFLERVVKAAASAPSLREIYVLSGAASAGPSTVAIHPYEALLDHEGLDLHELAASSEPDDLATLIFTSGTTGPPKGVMISQRNVVYTGEQLRRTVHIDDLEECRLISYLPMAHVAERMVSHYIPMMLGMEVTTCPDPALLPTYARAVRPEILFGVPRVYEKVYSGVQAALALDPEKKQKFDEAIAAALPIMEAKRNGTVTEEQQQLWDFLDAVAFSTVRELVGIDRVRCAVSAAAPLSADIIAWFVAIGVPLTELYGLSEASGPITWESDPAKARPGTVGPSIFACEVKVAADGEVLCQGGNVFPGYYKAPDKSAEVLIDGWLHTGDIGALADDDFLTIVDRKKELIITAGGKNISPANLEVALRSIPLIGQAAAIGDGRRFVSAILVLDPEQAAVWAKEHEKGGLSLAELAVDADLVAEVSRRVDEVNDRFATVEQIKRFTLVGEEWLPDTDVMTPTSKLKRRGINSRYASQIESMYR